ncbi:phage tail protein [Methylomagnum sp.]
MAGYYPPVGFFFEVKTAGVKTAEDSGFLEADGLNAEREIESIKEGGENRFVHRLPGRMKYENLVLKRGLLVATSDLATWCKEALQSDLGKVITVRDIDVSLLDSSGSPLMTWNFKNAWPVKWSVEGFNAMDNKIAVEKLEFAYSYFTRNP